MEPELPRLLGEQDLTRDGGTGDDGMRPAPAELAHPRAGLAERVPAEAAKASWRDDERLRPGELLAFGEESRDLAAEYVEDGF